MERKMRIGQRGADGRDPRSEGRESAVPIRTANGTGDWILAAFGYQVCVSRQNDIVTDVSARWLLDQRLGIGHVARARAGARLNGHLPFRLDAKDNMSHGRLGDHQVREHPDQENRPTMY
jgi:hypothetical protein